MSRISEIIDLLTSLTDNQIEALAPADRRLLQDQLERVERIVTGAAIVSDDRKAKRHEGGQSMRGKAAFLDELRDGRGRE
jgi:hypothetical protein